MERALIRRRTWRYRSLLHSRISPCAHPTWSGFATRIASCTSGCRPACLMSCGAMAISPSCRRQHHSRLTPVATWLTTHVSSARHRLTRASSFDDGHLSSVAELGLCEAYPSTPRRACSACSLGSSVRETVTYGTDQHRHRSNFGVGQSEGEGRSCRANVAHHARQPS
jgi:hypothetical protein